MIIFTFDWPAQHRRFRTLVYGREVGSEFFYIGPTSKRASLFTYSWRLK